MEAFVSDSLPNFADHQTDRVHEGAASGSTALSPVRLPHFWVLARRLEPDGSEPPPKSHIGGPTLRTHPPS